METTAITTKTSIIRTVDDLGRIGNMLAQSGYFSDARDAAQCGVKVMAGMEMGFGAFASMTGIYIISGKPSVGANLMASAVKSNPKYDYRVREHNDNVCKIEFFEIVNGKKESLGISEFTAKEAQIAGVKNMQKYPKNMLFARAMSNGIRWYCPDVFNGNPTYTPDELGADVDEEGNILSAQIVTPETQEKPEIIEGSATPVVSEAKAVKTNKPPYPGDEILLSTFELPADFNTILTIADAEAMLDSKGEPYGEKSLQTLYYMLDALNKRLERNHLSAQERQELEDKVASIYLIFAEQKKQGGF